MATARAMDDQSVVQRVLDHIANGTTDVGPEVWREVARAIGQVGPTALLPLASTYGRLGDKATPAVEERVSWAMAHVAVRGGKAAVETMAGGQSVVAPVAKHALELHASAAKDQTRVRPGAEGSQAGRDVTVNRAFSRKFFESLEQGIPDAGQAGLEALDASSPMEVLDEADVILDDEEADEEHEKEIKNYIEECVLHEIPERYRIYFDEDAFIEDCKINGRGHSLSRYSGAEEEETVNDTTYFIYQQ